MARRPLLGLPNRTFEKMKLSVTKDTASRGYLSHRNYLLKKLFILNKNNAQLLRK